MDIMDTHSSISMHNFSLNTVLGICTYSPATLVAKCQLPPSSASHLEHILTNLGPPNIVDKAVLLTLSNKYRF